VPESKKLPDAFPAWALETNLDTMSAALKASPSLTELFKLANDDEFKSAVYTLSAKDQTALRATYQEMRTRLDDKVKLESFDGQIVNIVGIDWWHSDRFTDESKGQTGDGVSLHLRTERDPETTVKAMTSSAPIVNFCNRLRLPPSVDRPLRVYLNLVPVRDPERAARGQKMWSIKQMPTPRSQSADNVPF
jgi:hypothetical protein